AREAIGTQQVLEHLAGKWTESEAMEQVNIITRRFAKAQRTWLKRFRGVHWLDADAHPAGELIAEAVRTVHEALDRSGSGTG
ncbi:MAG: hypothetical protein WD079_00060, partial [Phycisphaeraceae bacterium]